MTKLADLEDLQARLLKLFEGPLAGVRFPDVDAEILAAHARAAREAEARVEHLRAELEDARRVSDEEEGKLENRLERALAYLRVYADGNPALVAELETVSQGLKPARPESVAGPARRRGRPPKASGMLALDRATNQEEPEAVPPRLEVLRADAAGM